MIIGGVERNLTSWRPSPRKLMGIKPAVELAELPETYEIPGFPLYYDQGQLGSCGPNSLAEQYQFKLSGQRFSRLFAYFFTRATEGDFIDDDGVTIPDLVSVAHTMGMPPESVWPYDIDKFQTPPPLSALVEAVRHRVMQSDIVVDLDHMLFEIAAGNPVMFGFRVPASMQLEDAARTGMVKVPGAGDPIIGGHCVNAVGYDRARQLVKCSCHYGPDFGDHGAIYLPFAMWTSGNAMDMTVLRVIS